MIFGNGQNIHWKTYSFCHPQKIKKLDSEEIKSHKEYFPMYNCVEQKSDFDS